MESSWEFVLVVVVVDIVVVVVQVVEDGSVPSMGHPMAVLVLPLCAMVVEACFLEEKEEEEQLES